MNPEQLWETTMDPAKRFIVKVGIEDAAEAEKMVTILMGDRTDSRRQYITTHANFNKRTFFRKWGCNTWQEKKQTFYIQNPDKVISKPMERIMHDSMMPYAEYVIMERALPRVEDGLKPVQRRILYTMHELALTPEKPYKKSARIVGDTLGKYHPHGDTSVYDAMVRMAQEFNMRYPLVDGHGNFGSIDGDSAAAMRYTEARMTPLALELLRDLEKNTVTFSLNFDDSMKEPDVLPGRYPNLLVNGSSGIAVGLATNIPPHNLGEVIDGVIAVIDNPDITIEELNRIIPGPDFPTGGIIIGSEEIKNAYLTGKGRILLKGKSGDRKFVWRQETTGNYRAALPGK